MLPYWLRTAVDRRHGGYLLRDYGTTQWTRFHRWRARTHAPKHLVGQARMLFTLSRLHVENMADGSGRALDGARRGYEFLVEHFADDEFGGWRWETTREGAPRDQRKNAYGAFVTILAFVEYARASVLDEPLQGALDTYALVEQRFHDDVHGGWNEDLTRDWRPLPPDDLGMFELIGLKSANVHMHAVEAYTELAAATGDARVLRSLNEAVDVLDRHFYTSDLDQCREYRNPDWTAAAAPGDGLWSYGHHIEWAWLRLRAEAVLGREPLWDEFFAVVDAVLAAGFDHERGGVYFRGPIRGPATNRTKFDWVQAETIAALTEATLARPDGGYDVPLGQVVEFVRAHVLDPRDHMWFYTVAEDGQAVNRRKASEWQAGYHEVRAMVKFVHAFGARETGAA
jgi:mannobiose 2-epimerase